MTGNDFSIGQILMQGLKDITQYINPMLAVIASALTNMAKPIVVKFIPKMEAEMTDTVLRIVAMLICVCFGRFAMHLPFLATFTTGVITCYAYQLISAFIKSKDDTPVPPTK